MTRLEYINADKTTSGKHDPAKASRVHRAYYSQFVTDAVRAAVSISFTPIELERTFNDDINTPGRPALERWDETAAIAHFPAEAIKDAGETLTQAIKVCILKEAGRQLLESDKYRRILERK